MSEIELDNMLSLDQYILILTGLRGTKGRCHYHLAYFSGERVGFTNSCFVRLLQFAEARKETRSGFLQCPVHEDPSNFRHSIHKLRVQTDAHLGSGAGKKWIKTGVAVEYVLAAKAYEILVDATFKELPHTLVPKDLRDYLVAHCAEVDLEEYPEITRQLD